MKRIAVFDLGTNTFNLLIADVLENSFRIIHSEKDGVALGMGGINEGLITEEAMQRGLCTLARFYKTCCQFGVKDVRAFGTSALRGASNSAQFLKSVRDDLGINIQIISGDEEAEMIYNGVKWSYGFDEPAVIMDIGGGSTEFVFANSKGIEDKISLNIGVSRIFQQFQFNDPLSSEDILLILNWLDGESKGFFDDKKMETLIGASGSFETFYELIHKAPFPNKSNAIEVPFTQLRINLDVIIASTQAERNENPWIIPIRKKMAAIAALKTNWIIDKLDVSRILISPYSLKEGALRKF
ncbi:MAG: exopolyphosphatase [Bacteroidota bacterium]